MTNGWVDIKNTDMMLIMGGNPAENHPCGFKWAIEAKRNRNAKMIVVDPRFTRTASVADHFCQIRAGTDIAFLGGVIRYAIENKRFAKDYLVNYTNAAFIVNTDTGIYFKYGTDPNKRWKEFSFVFNTFATAVLSEVQLCNSSGFMANCMTAMRLPGKRVETTRIAASRVRFVSFNPSWLPTSSNNSTLAGRC